jgi:hypothetical protein
MKESRKYPTKAEFEKLKDDFSSFKDKVKFILSEIKDMIKAKREKKGGRKKVEKNK